jgi:hypothetical protein
MSERMTEERVSWINCNDRLPEWNRLVVAYCVGFQHHTGIDWKREGYAFMVRHNAREFVVGTDQWAQAHYQKALERIDADQLTVTHWMPLEPPL